LKNWNSRGYWKNQRLIKKMNFMLMCIEKVFILANSFARQGVMYNVVQFLGFRCNLWFWLPQNPRERFEFWFWIWIFLTTETWFRFQLFQGRSSSGSGLFSDFKMGAASGSLT
jgi:hypothetical protein